MATVKPDPFIGGVAIRAGTARSAAPVTDSQTGSQQRESSSRHTGEGTW